MREALKQAIERITIYPVKTGPHRKDTIVCGAYIAFKSGQRRAIVVHDNLAGNIPNFQETKEWFLRFIKTEYVPFIQNAKGVKRTKRHA